MKCWSVAGLAAMIALSGCGRNLKPPEHSFTVAAPKTWTGGETLPEARGVDWWAHFGDARLDKAVQLALTFNHDLRAAAARVEAAEADARIAGAALLPEIDVGVNRGRQRQNFVGFPIPGSEGRILSRTYTNAGLSLGLSWEPDVWGRLRSGQIAAIADAQVRQADLYGARLSLTGQLAKAWFAAIEAQRQVGISRAALASYRTSAERVRARFEGGIRPPLDLRLALSEQARAEGLLEERKQQLDAATRQLEILLGRYPSGAYELGEDLPRVPQGIPAGLPSELVHRRPDLVAAERGLLASDARIAEAQADLRPRFSLTSAFGTASDTLKDIVNNDLMIWSLVGNITQPLFNNGRLKATVKRNKAQSREAAAEFESAMLTAYNEVETALAAEDVLLRREKALEEATKQSLAARDLAEDRYRLGLEDIITVLSSQRSALESESLLLTVRRIRLDNRVNLHIALGGGFESTDLPAVPLPAGQSKTVATNAGGDSL